MGRTQKTKKIPSKKSKTSPKKHKTVKIKNIQSENENSPSKSKKNKTSIPKSSPSKLKTRQSKTTATKNRITKSTPKKPLKNSTYVSKKACPVPSSSTPSSSRRKSVIVNKKVRNNNSPGKFNAVQKKQIELLLPEGFEEVLGEIHDEILHEDIGNDSKSLAIWLKDFFVQKNGGIRNFDSKEFSGIEMIDTDSKFPVNPGKVQQSVSEKFQSPVLITEKVATETATTQTESPETAAILNDATTDFETLEQKLATTLTNYKTLQEELRIKQESTELTEKLIENHKIELMNAYSELEKIQELQSTVFDLTLEKILEKQSPVFIAHYNSKLEDLQAEYEHKLNQEIESMVNGNEKALQRVKYRDI